MQHRKAHNKKPLKDKDDDNDKSSPTNGSSKSYSKDEIPEGVKTRKCSITDPKSGWFRKGEHRHVFAYSVEAACNKFGWILGYSVHPGNLHDSRTFKTLYDKLLPYQPEMIVIDAGYKTSAIAHQLLTDGIKPLFPYKRLMTKDGFFKKYEYAYDELYDCYICLNDQILKYLTTNRDGYREYFIIHRNIGYDFKKFVSNRKVVLELSFNPNFVYSLKTAGAALFILVHLQLRSTVTALKLIFR